MTILDRWLLGRFVRAYLGFGAASTIAFVILDLFARPRAMETGGFLRTTLLRYLTMLPELFLAVGPFLAVVAALWVISTLRRQNELTALMAAGVGPRRLAVPLLIGSVLLAPLIWADRELLIPRLHQLHVAGRGPSFLRPRPVPDARGMLLAAYFQSGSGPNVLGQARYVRLDETGRERFVVFARTCRPVDGGWLFERGYTVERVRGAGADVEVTEPIPAGGFWLPTTILPSDIVASVNAPSYLSARDLRRQLRRTPGFRHLEAQLHDRATLPLAAVVLLLVVLPIALRGECTVDPLPRHLACTGVCLAYLLATNLCGELGTRDVLSPAVVLVPPIVFGGVGLWLAARS